jgi:hypothetical protein
MNCVSGAPDNQSAKEKKMKVADIQQGSYFRANELVYLKPYIAAVLQNYLKAPPGFEFAIFKLNLVMVDSNWPAVEVTDGTHA